MVVAVNWYGVIASLAIILGLYLAEWRLKIYFFSKKIGSNSKFNSKEVLDSFWSGAMAGVLGGVVGARLWHVATDFSYYGDGRLNQVFFVWQGGLSILGAILGGVLAIWSWGWYQKWWSLGNTDRWWLYLDAAVFGLPVAQALGRVGNWFNQELYGLPSDLPWAISISPIYRLAGYEEFSQFHPLFAYEALAILLFAAGLWYLVFKPKTFSIKMPTLGSSWYFWVYLLYYAGIRFGLDFLRIDKELVLGSGLGINQVILLILIPIFFWKFQQTWTYQK